jgi:Gnt-I system high-affinity gluconate transporter
MSLIFVAVSILLLLARIILLKINAFISFIIVSVLPGIVAGMTYGEVFLPKQGGIA